MSNTEPNSKAVMRFAAIDPYIETNIISPTESKGRDKDYVQWGDGNHYPHYLLDLYRNVTSLRSVINGCVDFAVGDDVTAMIFPYGDKMNRKGETARDLVKRIAWNAFVFGGYALQVIRSKDGANRELYAIDLDKLRTDEENEVFWYSENWGDKFVRSDKVIRYPKWMKEGKSETSIFFVKCQEFGAYPAPLYAAAVKACEVERSIDEYHLTAINNSFMGSYVINFNNGAPTQEIKEEIERNVNEKFAGKSNAGRIMLSWNDSKEVETTIQRLEQDDFGERYKTLASHCRQQIFTAFRANPNLFGIPTESLGFSSEEYESAFKLFNRTQIQPVQDLIVDSFDKILGLTGSIAIKPFSIERDTTQIIQ